MDYRHPNFFQQNGSSIEDDKHSVKTSNNMMEQIGMRAHGSHIADTRSEYSGIHQARMMIAGGPATIQYKGQSINQSLTAHASGIRGNTIHRALMGPNPNLTGKPGPKKKLKNGTRRSNHHVNGVAVSSKTEVRSHYQDV